MYIKYTRNRSFGGLKPTTKREVVLQRCYDNPLADPEDVIDGYLMEVWYMLREEKENANIIKMLRIIEDTLESLLRYLH